MKKKNVKGLIDSGHMIINFNKWLINLFSSIGTIAIGWSYACEKWKQCCTSLISPELEKSQTEKQKTKQ